MYMCVCMSNADNLLTKWWNVSFSRRALLHGVSSYICSLSDSDLGNRLALLTFFLIFVIMSKRIPWSSPIARRSKFLSDCHSWTFSQKCESYITYVFETSSLKWRKTLYFHINNCKVIFPFTAYRRFVVNWTTREQSLWMCWFWRNSFSLRGDDSPEICSPLRHCSPLSFLLHYFVSPGEEKTT